MGKSAAARYALINAAFFLSATPALAAQPSVSSEDTMGSAEEQIEEIIETGNQPEGNYLALHINKWMIVQQNRK